MKNGIWNFVLCTLVLTGLNGCAAVTFLLSNNQSITFQAAPSQAVDRKTSATITQQMVAITDRVTREHGLYLRELPETDPSTIYLRRYTDSSFNAVFVSFNKGEQIPTIYIQGSIGGVGVRQGIGREIYRALQQGVKTVKFQRKTHYETEFI